jgi:phenylalanyl-tRNA synthetase beta chain
MKIPLSWLSEFVEIPSKISNEDIEAAFVQVGFEVESVSVQGADIKGPLKVSKVVSIEELAGHKKPIRYVGLDCGEGSIRYVICGATNFEVGDFVVASLPGAVLPGGFEIAARETYGKTSNGMICSARELGISDEHAGIIVLPKSTEIAVGQDALKVLQISDVIFDIAVNPDRGYAMSVRGLSRELATSLQLPFKDPAQSVVDNYEINKSGVQVSIKEAEACSVIYMRTVENFDLNASVPMWMRRRIEKCGMRSISLAVDITNYVMLELGQPLHAFDADKVSGSLNIRKAGRDKELKTLDGVVRKLSENDLVVADEKVPLALAGTMGGESSEVSETTTRIALEAARFNPISVAQNSRRHILSSEASRRLERGVDPILAKISSARAIDLMVELGGAKHVGSASAGKEMHPAEVDLNPSAISNLLGLDIDNETIKKSLEAIGCAVKDDREVWKITPATWRADLNHYSDFAEEVARLIGYDKLPMRLPTGKSGAGLTSTQKRKRFVGSYLANLGFAEVYNYPFINQQYLESLGFKGDRAKTFKIANPMSEEFPVLRTHLLPGLFQTVQRNMGRGQKDVAIFEIGTLFRNLTDLPKLPDISTTKKPNEREIAAIYSCVPKQPIMMAGVVAGKLHRDGWQGKGEKFQWNDAIELTKNLLTELGQEFEVSASDFAPWHPGRCAEFRVNGKPVAHAGELHPRVISDLNLPERSCAFGILLSELPEASVFKAEPINAMTPVIQDLALVVDSEISVAAVESAVTKGAGDLLESVELFDRYDKLGDGKISLAFTLVFRAPDRNLTTEEVNQYRESAIAVAAKECGAQPRS